MYIRRRQPRMPTPGWTGRCAVEGSTRWIECSMVDLSVVGAGLELTPEARGIQIGTRLAVEVGSGSIFFLRFAGEVRRVDLLGGGVASVGMEFVDGTTTERSVLMVMEQLGVFDADGFRRESLARTEARHAGSQGPDLMNRQLTDSLSID